MGDPWRVVRWGDVDATEWDRCADRSPDGWLWHTSDLQDALDAWPSRSSAGIAVADADGAYLAILPVHVLSMRRGGVVPLRQLDSLGGPAFAPELDAAARTALWETWLAPALLKLAGDVRALSVELRGTAVAPGSVARQPDRALAWPAATKQAWVTDLRPGTDALWSAMQGRSRTAVRKAEREGVTVRPTTPADVDHYHALHVDTYERTGVPPHPREYFQLIWDRFVARDRAAVVIAEHEGRVIGAQSIALHKDAAVYWTGASTTDALRLGANNLLQWEAMKLAAERGAAFFENGDAFPDGTGKQRGLHDFKRSFGGALWPVPTRTIATGRPLLRLVDRATTVVARVRRGQG